jgi:hypothetical protein
MITKKKKGLGKVSKKQSPKFYDVKLSIEKEGDTFFPEYSILLKTTESVNSFSSLYRVSRTGATGPSTHAQQDLYRAMLIFACAGLDVLVKQLIKTKLVKLVASDPKAQEKFKEYVKRGLKKDDKEILNTVALALIDENPREVFLKEYIENMTGDSLQSVEELCKVSNASGLDTDMIFNRDKMNSLKDAFIVRNQIIHEMDINTSHDGSKTTGYRTRRQRLTPKMEGHTKIILDLAQDIFSAYKEKFLKLKIEVEKEVGKGQPI